jgi:rod shape-determining protein MreC
MFRVHRDRAAVILLAGIQFGLLVWMSAQVKSGETSLLDATLFRLASPGARLATGGVSTTRGAWENYLDLRGARRENQQLREELLSLEVQRSRYEEVLRENRRLRDLLDFAQRVEVDGVIAPVLANQALAAQRTILIGRGADDGVQVDAPVLCPEGVVGRVTAVAGTMAKVQLITDSGSGVASAVARTRLQGLVAGRGADTLRLRYIPLLEDVHPGDRLVTSGLEGIYPPGFPIGVVLRVAATSGVMKEIDVAAAADFLALEEVLVLRTISRPSTPGAWGASAPGPAGE